MSQGTDVTVKCREVVHNQLTRSSGFECSRGQGLSDRGQVDLTEARVQHIELTQSSYREKQNSNHELMDTDMQPYYCLEGNRK